MGAYWISITCPVCQHQVGARLRSTEREWPFRLFAEAELSVQCPEHVDRPWEFLDSSAWNRVEHIEARCDALGEDIYDYADAIHELVEQP